MHKFFIAVLAIAMFGCKKDHNPAPNPNPNPTPTPTPSPSASVQLSFPTTVGTWWKYERIDTTKTISTSLITKDTSEELITIVGKTSLPNGPSEVITLKIQNLKTGNLDTNYMELTTSKFALYPAKAAQVPFTAAFFKLSMPLYNKPVDFTPFSNTAYPSVYVDTIKTLLDTSIQQGTTNYTKCQYANRLLLSKGGSLGSVLSTFDDRYFFKQDIGIVFSQQLRDGTVELPYGFRTIYFRRRLIDYKIMP
jgi:hypothetical protein